MVTRLAALSAVIMGLIASPAFAQSPSPEPTTTPAAAVTIHMKGFTFAPNPVTIKTGDTVAFVNDDTTEHTATADDKSWDSGNMEVGATYTHTFATAGTVTYNCAYHSYMRGTIVVK